ncbi:MAG: chemotaxis-specific protein-glutamate methyltransferase CheB [Planctomycetota bacterium]
MPIRVLVVDDSSFMRRLLTRAFDGARGFELVGEARDGVDALAKVAQLDPDLITLDIEMPRKNGLEVLKDLRARHPRRPSVVMCSSLTTAGSEATLEALRLGASDFIAKSSSFSVADAPTFERELLEKARAVAPRAIAALNRGAARAAPPSPGAAGPSGASPIVKRSAPAPSNRRFPESARVLVVGSSTGGPPVLEALVRSLPEGYGVPVVIAQHMPELFTRSLATRLDRMTPLHVRLAESGQGLKPGTVTIARGGAHVVVGSRGGVDRISVTDEPSAAIFKPDVDVLFESAAEAFGSGAVGMILTGMGDDGADGAGVIRAKGGYMLTQDEDSCVVYGMPKAVDERGDSDRSGSPEELFALIAKLQSGGRQAYGLGGGRRSA